MNETTDAPDTAQLVSFTYGVNSNLFIMEKILDVKLMHGTTGKDFSKKICKSVTDKKLSLYKLFGLTSDGVLAMHSEKVDWWVGYV